MSTVKSHNSAPGTGTHQALPDRIRLFRDTRNSFASYAEEVGIPQATREYFLGHGAKGVTNRFYTDLTSKLLSDATSRLSSGWSLLTV